MLVSCKLTGSAANIAAYHAKEENYYFSQAGGVESLTGDPSAQGHVRVHGALAARLGFTPGASISEVDLAGLLSGKNAAGEKVGHAHKVIGIDLTFSAPKSVSVAGLLTDRDPAILAAHDRAVLETMREIERYCAATQKHRRGKTESVKTGNLAYVTVRDGFNREHDPHLHTHVVVMNMTEFEGKVMTLDGKQIMRQDFNKMWGAMYRAKLAAYLKEAGHSVSYTKKGELRMDSVSLEVEREFSTRRAEILAAKDRGIRDMAAWRATRKEKDPEVEKAGVLRSWRERLARHEAKTAEQNRAEAVADRGRWMHDAKYSIEARQELAGERGDTEAARWQAAARRATEQSASVTPHALITEYLTEVARGEAWAPITYGEAEQRLLTEVRSGRILATDDGRFTTWEMARADRDCLRERQAPPALVLRGDSAAFQVAEYVKTAQGLGRRGLSEQQAAAAAGVLSAGHGTVVVQGDAGAGKTTMLRAVHEIAGRNGWEVVGLAVQGVAARKLEEESGIRSSTLTSYLARERAEAKVRQSDFPGRPPRLLVIDESSMLGSRDLSELLYSAEIHRDKVVLVGDRNQIQAIGAGRPFDRLVEAAERAGQLLNLSENYRQRNRELREAVTLARDGHMRESLDVLARTGRVTEISDASLRRLAVAAAYDKDTLILTGSRESRDVLNGLIREDLVKRGLVDRSTAYSYALSWTDADGIKQRAKRELAVGDVVTFLDNDYRAYDVRNGERGQVVKTTERELTVRLEDGRTVELDLKRYAALDYGYAMTTYKSQGQTYNKVVVDADTSVAQLQDQRNTYVQITRARDDVRVFTDDKGELRELAGVLNFKSDTLGIEATYEKAAAMERRAYAQAYGTRAEREAQAKSILAKAAGADAAGRMEQMATNEQTPADGTAKALSWEERLARDRAADPPGTVRLAPKDETLEEFKNRVQAYRNANPPTAGDINDDHAEALWIESIGGPSVAGAREAMKEVRKAAEYGAATSAGFSEGSLASEPPPTSSGAARTGAPSPQGEGLSAAEALGASSRFRPDQVPLPPSVTAHPTFVKAFEEARELLEKLAADGAANVLTPDFIYNHFRRNHTRMHEIVDEVKKHGRELAPEKRAALSAELDRIGANELALSRLANIVTEPEAWIAFYSKRDAGAAAGAVPVPKDILASQKFLSDEIGPVVVTNDGLLAKAGKSSTLREGYERQLAAVTSRLRELAGFNEDEKRRVARVLATEESVATLQTSIGRPERAVAFGLVRAGLADVTAATRGLTASDAADVEKMLKTAKNLPGRAAEQNKDRPTEGGLGLGL